MKKVILLICLAMFCFGGKVERSIKIVGDLERSCNKNNNIESCRILADMYAEDDHSNDEGRIKHDSKAFEYFSKACDLGDVKYCRMAADLYLAGNKAEHLDWEKASEYYTKACGLGDAEACEMVKIIKEQENTRKRIYGK